MEPKKVTILNLCINALLFILKFFAGIAANSVAVMADATNSLIDVVYSIAVIWSVRISHKHADHDHQFGHGRAEPLVAFTVALLMAIIAFEFLKEAIVGLFSPEEKLLTIPIVLALVIAIMLKIFLGVVAEKTGKEHKSQALLATAADCRNDVLITSTALLGLFFASNGYPWMDNVAAILISGFLFLGAYKIGRENFDYLIGSAPPQELIDQVREITRKVRGVKGVHQVRAHYLGTYVQFEVHIVVDRDLSTERSHAIAVRVKEDLGKLQGISDVFVHIDPL